MHVVDVDSHFMEPLRWIEDVDPDLAAEIPVAERVRGIGLGPLAELLAGLPEEARMDASGLLPEPLRKLLDSLADLPPDRLETLLARTPFASSYEPAERVAWMDERGIDVQILNPTIGAFTREWLKTCRPELLGRYFRAYNTWTARTVSGHADRLLPAAQVLLDDLPAAVAELERARRGGSRSLVLDPTPVDGVAIVHPDFDRLWAALSDLGMIVTLHVGYGAPSFARGWANQGAALTRAAALAFASLHQVPQTTLAAMLLSHLFDRFPKLRVLVSEFGVEWVPAWIGRLDRMAAARGPLALADPPSRLPSEWLGEQIFFSPLRVDDVGVYLERLGTRGLLFASDYPHPEGSAEAVSLFGDLLKPTVPEHERARFFGEAARGLLAVD